MDALTLLTQFQRNIDERNANAYSVDKWERLAISRVADCVRVDFFGSPFDESFDELLTLLIRPEVASALVALSIDGPDEGMNGTCNWDLSTIVESSATFPQLVSLSIKRTSPREHNRSIVARDYSENGVLAKLLDRTPQLKSLSVPSAPNDLFFKRAEHPLERLVVDAGFDRQGFIENLASSTCFPELGMLEWGEYCEVYLNNWQASCTPLTSFQNLLASPAFAKVDFFRWCNPHATVDEIKAIQQLRRNLQLHILRTTSEFA